MKVELKAILPLFGSLARVRVRFLLPGCNRWRPAECVVEVQGMVCLARLERLQHVPKKLRDRMGEAGLERLRAECLRLFLAGDGVKIVSDRRVKQEAEERQRKIREATSSLTYSADKLFGLGVDLQTLEDLIRELAAKRVMEA